MVPAMTTQLGGYSMKAVTGTSKQGQGYVCIKFIFKNKQWIIGCQSLFQAVEMDSKIKEKFKSVMRDYINCMLMVRNKLILVLFSSGFWP